MYKLKESPRIKNIENRWSNSVEKLLYNWHWKDNLKHKEIGEKLNIPRPTITRWFKELKIPTQSHTRFTNNNLLYVGPNRPPKKLKPYKKPKERIQVNENFFKKWSPEMAYVLGYFTADGCMFINPRGSRYIGFYSTDYELILKVRKILNSKHKIGVWEYENLKWKKRYQIQIGSKRMYQDLTNHGLMPNKSKVLKLPSIPKTYFRHFVRGYFDGDGGISLGNYFKKDRNKPTFILHTHFVSGSKYFLKNFFKTLKKQAKLRGGCIYYKKSDCIALSFSIKDSLRLCKFMYESVQSDKFLERKYNIFQKALNHWGA